jgi:hypothetical protein
MALDERRCVLLPIVMRATGIYTHRTQSDWGADATVRARCDELVVWARYAVGRSGVSSGAPLAGVPNAIDSLWHTVSTAHRAECRSAPSGDGTVATTACRTSMWAPWLELVTARVCAKLVASQAARDVCAVACVSMIGML